MASLFLTKELRQVNKERKAWLTESGGDITQANFFLMTEQRSQTDGDKYVTRLTKSVSDCLMRDRGAAGESGVSSAGSSEDQRP